MGKHVCVHTHINCKQEISWILRKGAQRLYEEGVTVRNQSVLLNGVNNTVEAMGELIHALGDLNIEPVSRRKLSQPFVARVPKANSGLKVLRSSG